MNANHSPEANLSHPRPRRFFQQGLWRPNGGIVFLALRNLQAHAARTLLSALAIALGVGMVLSTDIVKSGMTSAWGGGENKMAFFTDMASILFTGTGVMLLLAAGFLVFNAFAMSVTQQRQQIGMLRSLGMARRQVLRQVLVEALLTCGLGLLIGLVAGPLLGGSILLAMRSMKLDTGSGSITLQGVLLAASMALGISLLSALLPARRAAHTSPLAALRETDLSLDVAASAVNHRRIGAWRFNRRPAAGLALLALLWAYLLITPPGNWIGKYPPWDWVLFGFLVAAWLLGLILVLPAWIAGLLHALRRPLNRLGITGRLLSDNLERAPGRVTLTSLSFAVGLMTLVATAAFVTFNNEVLVQHLAENTLRSASLFLYPFDRASGLGQLAAFDVNAPGLNPTAVAEARRLAEGRALVSAIDMVVIPEIASPMPGFPSFIYSDVTFLTHPGQFDLLEGDWDATLSRLRQGCGILITPAVAGRNQVALGEKIVVSGRSGPVECVVAGIGAGGLAAYTVVGSGAREAFVDPAKDPDSLRFDPYPGQNILELAADLQILADRYPGKVFVSDPKTEWKTVLEVSDQLMQIFNALMLLAVAAAALGMINTTLMNVLERRRELGLLRAVGAPRRQTIRLVVGEAALTGLIGALLGTLIGLGIACIYCVAYGGASFGLVDLPLWQETLRILPTILGYGLPAFAAAPVLAALSALPAARRVLRGSVLETLQPGSF